MNPVSVWQATNTDRPAPVALRTRVAAIEECMQEMRRLLSERPSAEASPLLALVERVEDQTKCLREAPTATWLTVLAKPAVSLPRAIPEAAATLPAGAIHNLLTDKVTFVPYPREPFCKPSPAPEKLGKERLLFSQLPYDFAWIATCNRLEWVLSLMEIETGTLVTELVAKNNILKPACAWVYCDPSYVNSLMDSIKDRILIDSIGIWHAKSAKEVEELHQYTESRRKDLAWHFPIPRGCVVVERAPQSS